jgi:hypothetical protein
LKKNNQTRQNNVQKLKIRQFLLLSFIFKN